MTLEDLKPGYEVVFTVLDHQDGPVSGIADFQGSPHFYESVFDAAEEDYSTTFRLTPLDPETFQLAMEDWEIWKRWKNAFHAGKTDLSTHPALPHEADRHAELERVLDDALATDPQKAITRVGHFDMRGDNAGLPKGVIRPQQVRWTEPEAKSSQEGQRA